MSTGTSTSTATAAKRGGTTTPRSGASLAFSHMGVYVHDIETMERFYTGALEFDVTDRGLLGKTQIVFLSRDPAEHHQIILATGRPAHIEFNPINQISLRADSLASLRIYHDRALAHGATDMQPVSHGNALSIYFRDPEGNRLEVFIDTPWYVTQPMRIPVDLSMDDATLMAHLEAEAQALPGYIPHNQWLASMAERMGIKAE